jgi:ubiquinone/menaquinone biosynthesis C-methylase UbiE
MSPTPDVTPERIFQVATGFMAAKHLFVAGEIRLFEALADGPLALDEIAQGINVPRRTTRIIADAMVALGFLSFDGSRYQNAPVAMAFLSGRGSADFRPFLRFWNHISYHKWAKLEESVRAGRGTVGRFQFSGKEEEEIFSRGVEAFSSGGAQTLSDAYDFSRHRHVLDLGGGTGSFLLPLLERYPTLAATLFELPAVVQVARQRLMNHPLADRIRLVEGDMFRSPIPEGHDACIIANVLHTLSRDHILEMFTNLRRHMRAGARLLLIDLFTNPSHTEPTLAALMAGEFLVMTSEGDVYSEQEVCEYLRQTGWKALERKALSGPSDLLVAEAASN